MRERDREVNLKSWCFFWEASERLGGDVYEIHVGDFEGQITFWNENSGFIYENPFEIFRYELENAVFCKDKWHGWYGSNCLTEEKQKLLKQRLLHLKEGLVKTSTCKEMAVVFHDVLFFKETQFEAAKKAINQMIDDFIRLVDKALEQKTALWLMGP